MARVLIVANGEWPQSFDVEENISQFSVLVALDGATNRLIELNIIPDVVIGDLDSIHPDVLEQCNMNGTQIVHDSNQELSDISKGLGWVKQHYPDSYSSVVGIEIGRYDHHLAAYSALFECKSSAVILLDGWKAQRVDSTPREIKIQPGKLVSLIPFGAASGVHLDGCKYPLNHESLSSGTRGVSNEAVDSVITVSVESGDLLLLVQG